MAEEKRDHDPLDVVVTPYGPDDDRKDGYLLFWCPGCKCMHQFRTAPLLAEPVWDWNGDRQKPTFSPSLLINKSDPESRCHSFVRNGQIQFLSDCYHELAGQTVDLIPFDEV